MPSDRKPASFVCLGDTQIEDRVHEEDKFDEFHDELIDLHAWICATHVCLRPL